MQSVQAVKYLYKYITKGSDQVTFTFRNEHGVEEQVRDEIETFVNARYISARESFWGIYQFPLHNIKPPVKKLPCHLPGEQMVLYEVGEETDVVAREPVTKLMDYFQLNAQDPETQDIIYPDIPKYFVWKDKKWQRRKRGQLDENHQFMGDSLGRIPTISLSRHQAELYYLQMLLHHKAGATSYQDLSRDQGTEYATFQEACLKLGLLDDDDEKDRAMEEAALIRFGSQLREIFCTIFLYCMPVDIMAFWDRWKHRLAEDIMYQNKETEMSELTMHMGAAQESGTA